jgi:hypothetical protein
MKPKNGGAAADRRLPPRWILLCAFSFGLGMLFSDQ